MRLGFLGGSFDPPHRAHLAVARAAQEAFALDRVLLAPVGAQPLKPGGAEASFADRLAMTRLLCDEQPELEATGIDGPRDDGRPNYTVETLATLAASATGSSSDKSSQNGLFVITGADAFAGLRAWREPGRLLAMAQWIVVSRPGIPMAEIEAVAQNAEQRAHIHLLNALDDPLSASELRERLRAGQDCSAWVPAAVLEYIHRHHLYGA